MECNRKKSRSRYYNGDKNNFIRSSHAYTDIKISKFSFKWKINNFLYFGNLQDNSLISPDFPANDYLWYLVIHPHHKVHARDEETYVSVIVCMANWMTEGKNKFQEACLELSLIGAREKEYEVYNCLFTNKDMMDDAAFTVEKFINRNSLANRSRELLPNNELTICCKLMFNEEISPPAGHLIEEIPIARHPLRIDDFEQLFRDRRFSDVKLVVGDEEFYVYKRILAACSRVFAAAFEQLDDEVRIQDVEAEVMLEALRFIYVGKIRDVGKLAPDLLLVAEKYEIEGLKDVCEQALVDNLSIENVESVLALVDRCGNARKLKTAAIEFLCENTKDLVNSEDSMNVLALKNKLSLLAQVLVASMSKS